MTETLPPLRFVRVFVWRTTLIWSALHIMSLFPSFRVGPFPVRAFVFAFVVTMVLVLLDAERRNERRFLANLGVSRLAILGMAAACFVSLEVLLTLLTGGLLR